MKGHRDIVPFVRPAAALLALCLLAAPMAATARQAMPPEGTPIERIEIRGAETTREGRIRAVMQLAEGEGFSAEALRRDLQAIADIGSYNPLTISVSTERSADEGLVLVVEVEENPRIASISFVGNVAFRSDRMTRELDFKVGDILPTAARASTARNIRRFYADGGFRSAIVRVNVTDAIDGEGVDVQVIINEGEKIRIRDLRIDGNSHFSDFRIRTWVANSGSWAIFRNYYDDRAFDDDLRLIEARYADAGFLDARARRGVFDYDQERAVVSPRIVIEEGPRYVLERVSFEGVTLFNEDEVQPLFAGRLGRPYNGDRMRQSVERLRVLYGNEGHVDARFEPRFLKDPGTGTVEVVIRVEEGRVVYVGNVRIQKDTYDYQFDLNALERFMDWTSPGVRDEALIREVRLQPGEKFRTADEVRTVERLRNLGFLQSARVRRVPTDDPAVDDVVVAVEQDPAAGYLGVTAGIGERSGPAVSFSYVNPNLFGEARVLRAGATVGRRLSSFSLGYLDRQWRDTNDSMEYQLYRDAESLRGWGYRTYGASAEYGTPFSEYVKGFLRLRVEQVRLVRRDQRLREPVDSYEVIALRPMLVRDRRDDRRWTTKGYLVSGGIETGYASGALLKFLHDLEWYQKLDEDADWVYAYAHRAGVQPYSASSIGITERFFLGGSGSLRGFAYRGVGPRDPGARSAVVGGTVMAIQRHELRHRFNKFLRGRVFLDAGIVEDGFDSWGSPRASAGVGVSVDLGVFVVDVDLGRPIAKRSRDRSQLVHFRVRSNF